MSLGRTPISESKLICSRRDMEGPSFGIVLKRRAINTPRRLFSSANSLFSGMGKSFLAIPGFEKANDVADLVIGEPDRPFQRRRGSNGHDGTGV